MWPMRLYSGYTRMQYMSSLMSPCRANMAAWRVYIGAPCIINKPCVRPVRRGLSRRHLVKWREQAGHPVGRSLYTRDPAETPVMWYGGLFASTRSRQDDHCLSGRKKTPLPPLTRPSRNHGEEMTVVVRGQDLSHHLTRSRLSDWEGSQHWYFIYLFYLHVFPNNNRRGCNFNYIFLDLF